MNDVVPHTFMFEQNAVRAVFVDDEPWFVGKDVCEVLGHGNPRQAMSRLDNDERDDVQIMDAMGRMQLMAIVSEPGVWGLALTSRTEQAKKFKRWLKHEVLPMLRRTGAFMIGEPSTRLPMTRDMLAFGLPIAKVNTVMRAVATTNAVAGPEAARLLYSLDPDMPDLSGFAVGALVGSAKDDPVGCLNHLLRQACGNGVTIGQMLTAALHDKVAAGSLKKFGIVAHVPGLPNFVAVAKVNGFLRGAFAETQWQGEWEKGLLGLAGALPYRGRLTFGHTISGAILIPRDVMQKPRSAIEYSN